MSGDDTVDVDALDSDIHGEEVDPNRRCDYCNARVDSDGSVQYEAIQLAELPNFEAVLDVPAGWILDALRCSACERESISPMTNGYNEALISVRLAERPDKLTVDATTMEVIDVSQTEEGHTPPAIKLKHVLRYHDLGMVRWIRIKGLFESTDRRDELFATLFGEGHFPGEIPSEVEGLFP